MFKRQGELRIKKKKKRQTQLLRRAGRVKHQEYIQKLFKSVPEKTQGRIWQGVLGRAGFYAGCDEWQLWTQVTGIKPLRWAWRLVSGMVSGKLLAECS